MIIAACRIQAFRCLNFRPAPLAHCCCVSYIIHMHMLPLPVALCRRINRIHAKVTFRCVRACAACKQRQQDEHRAGRRCRRWAQRRRRRRQIGPIICLIEIRASTFVRATSVTTTTTTSAIFWPPIPETSGNSALLLPSNGTVERSKITQRRCCRLDTSAHSIRNLSVRRE